MRTVIAGGSGLLGRALSRRLTADGHEVVVLSRRARTDASGARDVAWQPGGPLGPWAREVAEADAIVNLAGASIAGRRWSARRKAELAASRIDSTNSLVDAVRASGRKPAVFIQGSAVGYYGSSQSDRIFDEDSAPGQDFLGDLAVEWENAARPVEGFGCRLVLVRTGVVLAREGGALPPMARPFRFFVGGPVGSGRQYLSWISLDDWVSLVIWAMTTAAVSGPINAAAPTPVTNAEFSAALARALGRPNWMPAPAFALRALFGEMAASILLGGQRVLPTRPLALGFRFQHETIDAALAQIV